MVLQLNPNNPRTITGGAIADMAKSIFHVPGMLLLRPMVYEPETGYILGGNVRFLGIEKLRELLAGVKFPPPIRRGRQASQIPKTDLQTSFPRLLAA